jgi:Asp-tRNA(Asn)/Glu-tRNA(Gln) amidotransferase C subunit
MANSLWHEVTEEEKEEIRKESKSLMNNFASKLSKVKTSENHFENETGFREEGAPWETPQDFKDLTMLNAPFVEDDFIVAEKGGWKK